MNSQREETAIPHSLNASKPRFFILDLIRFVAAIAVLAYHYTARDYSGLDQPPAEVYQAVSWFTAYGFLGVQLFFLISGFVILLSVRGRGLGSFIASRISRLYPAYWGALILTTALLVWIAPQLGSSVTLPQFLVNLTMLQTGLGVPNVDGVYWTLWVELLFYTFVAVLIAIRLTDTKVYLFALLWPIVGLCVQQLLSGPLPNLLSAKYAPFFAAGMILFLIHERGHNVTRWILLCANVTLGTWQTVRYEVPGAEKATGLVLSAAVVCVVMVAIFVIVAAVTVSPVKFRGARWMTYAGALTYPLYLIHQYWGWWMIGLVYPFAGRWVALIAGITVSTSLAVILERWVERPLRPRIRSGVQAAVDVGTRRRLTTPGSTEGPTVTDEPRASSQL